MTDVLKLTGGVQVDLGHEEDRHGGGDRFKTESKVGVRTKNCYRYIGRYFGDKDLERDYIKEKIDDWI